MQKKYLTIQYTSLITKIFSNLGMEWNLPSCIKGIYKNLNGERLRASPLKSGTSDIHFTSLQHCTRVSSPLARAGR